MENVLNHCDDETLRFCFDVYFSLSAKLDPKNEDSVLGMPLALIKKLKLEIDSQMEKISADIILMFGRCIIHMVKVLNNTKTFKRIMDDFLPLFLEISIYYSNHPNGFDHFTQMALNQLEIMISEFPREVYFGIFNFFNLKSDIELSVKGINILRALFSNEKYNIIDVIFKEANRSLRIWIKEDMR